MNSSNEQFKSAGQHDDAAADTSASSLLFSPSDPATDRRVPIQLTLEESLEEQFTAHFCSLPREDNSDSEISGV